MVTKMAKWTLVNTKLDPLIIARIWGITENECWDYLNNYKRVLNQAAANRDGMKIRNEAREWAESLPEAYETKRQSLLEKLRNAKDSNDPNATELLTQYQAFTGKLTELTSHQIERARQYPIKDLLKVIRDITHCPFHDDKTASMNIKNNYYYCHGCGATGDTIKLLMNRDHVSFKEAVLKLL